MKKLNQKNIASYELSLVKGFVNDFFDVMYYLSISYIFPFSCMWINTLLMLCITYQYPIFFHFRVCG
jgi:hypothetical protein